MYLPASLSALIITPRFQPVPGYLREMRHYGVLPADQPDTVPVNYYELDRKYWQSWWYQSPASQ